MARDRASRVGMESEANIQLSPEDRARLEGWVAGRNTPQKLVWRARIVLMWGHGAGVTAIVGRPKRPRGRPIAGAIASRTRRGGASARRQASRTQAAAGGRDDARVVKMTLHERPPAATHWSARKLAKAVGLSHTSVQRIWAAHGLKPHLMRASSCLTTPNSAR